MRFVLAIAAFVVAAAMIVLGIAQRTVFLPPAAVSYEVTVKGDLPYTVIDGSTMTALPGKQSVTATGADTVFVAYGRTDDVKAWLGDSPYATVSFNSDKSALVSKTHEGATSDGEGEPTSAPTDDAGDADSDAADTAAEVTANPAGSDLWLMENLEEDAVIAPMSIPENVSVIVASDGENPAPADLKLTWPSDNSTPWAGPLIVGGILMLLVGLALYLLGINHLRRSRGPRRKGVDQGPKRRRLGRAPQRTAITAKRTGPGRARMAVVPALLVASLGLSGCSQAFWPDFTPDESAAATPTPTATAEGEPAPEPSVTVPQLERIMARVSAVATEADSARDADLAKTRFAGAALTEREANYTIREKLSDYPAPAAIPAAPLSVTLPKATDSWPRSVVTMIKDENDTSVAPTVVVLQQKSPRENYKVMYTQRLEPDAVVPELAPASVGAAFIQPDSAWLSIAPGDVAAAYADVVSHGEKSEYAALFDTSGDALLTAIAADREKKANDLPDTAKISFEAKPGDGEPISLATLNSGALVAVNMLEVETVEPDESGAVIKFPGTAMSALVGLDETAKGVQTTYSDQLLFYIPPAGSDEKARLLGFSQGLVSASELK